MFFGTVVQYDSEARRGSIQPDDPRGEPIAFALSASRQVIPGDGDEPVFGFEWSVRTPQVGDPVVFRPRGGQRLTRVELWGFRREYDAAEHAIASRLHYRIVCRFTEHDEPIDLVLWEGTSLGALEREYPKIRRPDRLAREVKQLGADAEYWFEQRHAKSDWQRCQDPRESCSPGAFALFAL